MNCHRKFERGQGGEIDRSHGSLNDLAPGASTVVEEVRGRAGQYEGQTSKGASDGGSYFGMFAFMRR
jgi:hypothetical protein